MRCQGMLFEQGEQRLSSVRVEASALLMTTPGNFQCIHFPYNNGEETPNRNTIAFTDGTQILHCHCKFL